MKTLILLFFLATLSRVNAQTSLNYFTGYQNGDDIEFYWQTAYENNLDYFTINISTDDCFTFVSFASVSATGTTSSASNYTCIDTTITLNDCYCFELRAYDLSGNQQYLDTVIVCYSTGLSTQNHAISASDNKIFPNPVTDNLLNINLDKTTCAEIKIFNLAGQSKLTTDICKNNSVIDCKGLPTGIYFIQIKDSNGNIFNQKFIKM